MNNHRSLLSAVALLSSLSASAQIIIDESTIGASAMIPAQGETVTWLIPILNDGKERWQGKARVTMRVARRGQTLAKPVEKLLSLDLGPGERRDARFAWTPARNGWFNLVFELDEPYCRVTRSVAVTARRLYFVWFGSPKAFQWCNVPTTVKLEEESWWLRRGAIPAAWKGGVCYKKWPVEKFVQSWGDRDFIAIDEVGGPGKTTDKFIQAWKQLKQKKPNQWIAVWYMGAHRYWADVKHLVDLFLPEIYLNYSGNQLGKLDAYLNIARETGVIGQVIPGLGINQIRDKKTKRITNSPTQADVLRQVRHLKRTAPELNGIGFFTAYTAAPGVAEYADRLCGEYYIKPVLTLAGLPRPLRVSGAPSSRSRTATAQVTNVGGMDADRITAEWIWGRPEAGAHLTRQVKGRLPVGETATFTLSVQPPAGWTPLCFRLVGDDDHTILDGEATVLVVRCDNRAVPVRIRPGAATPAAARFVRVDRPGPYHAVELSAAGTRTPLPCATLPAMPGTGVVAAVFPASPDPQRERLVLLEPGRPQPAPPPAHERKQDVLRVHNRYYEAELDLARDTLARLSPAGGMDNVLRGPWRLSAKGHSGFAEPQIEELPGCLVVTVPFESDDASGASQYVFLDYSPVIRVARSWQPKREVTLRGASDRCELFQKGGAFALQRGIGGVVQRGRLRDTSKYHDLYFGYLGGPPSPQNADKAGWFDMSYGAPDADGGLGVAIGYRWQDSDTKSYDVTRLYDADDWLEVLYLWGKEKTFTRPQASCVYLIPHRRLDLSDPAILAPAETVWRQVHARQLEWQEP